jgi:Transmembrane domain of unknown function (DUF3566)
VASSKHERGEQPGAASDPSVGSSRTPNREKSFLDGLRDAKGDDRSLTSAGRRLRAMRSKNSGRTASSAQPVETSRSAAAPEAGRVFEVFDHPLGSERTPETLETPRVPGLSAAPPRTGAGVRPLEAPPPRPTEERLRKAKRTRRRATSPRPRPARGAVRRVRRTVKRVDPWSVLKMSLFYYLIFFVVWMIGVAMLFSFVESTGVFDTIEGVGRGMEVEQLETFEISLGGVLRWAAYIGAGLVLVASVVNVILAFLYNLGSDIVGGIVVTFVERDE